MKTQTMIKDEHYIQIYDKLGSKYFGKMNDEELKKRGHSEEEIKQMKINCVKGDLEWYKKAVNIYKMLNELAGGKNAI